MLRQKAGSMLTLFRWHAAHSRVGRRRSGAGSRGGAGSAEAASLPHLSEALNQEAKISGRAGRHTCHGLLQLPRHSLQAG